MVRKSRLPGWFWIRGPRPDNTSCGVRVEEGTRTGGEGEGVEVGGSTKVGMLSCSRVGVEWASWLAS